MSYAKNRKEHLKKYADKCQLRIGGKWQRKGRW